MKPTYTSGSGKVSDRHLSRRDPPGAGIIRCPPVDAEPSNEECQE